MELTPRQQKTLDLLKQDREVQIETLSDFFSVTTQTVRRDVNQLCELGLARRVHGGLSIPPTVSNTEYSVRDKVESRVKESIAKRAADAIPDGSTLMMGIGTTVTRIARYLYGKKSLRVISNNLQVVNLLEDNPDIEIFVAGGQFRRVHQDMIGASVLSFFQNFEADIGIIGCGAVTSKQNVMEHEVDEAELSRCIMANCQTSWLVADASKWHNRASIKVANVDCFDAIYTNQQQLANDLPVSLVVDK